MTNQNELDEILMTFLFNGYGQDAEVYMPAADDAKQAITSLTKELVAEAKPEKQFDLGQVVYVEDTGGKRAIGRWVRDQQQFQIKNGTGSDYMDGYNAALDQFEQNLLKALEEK